MTLTDEHTTSTSTTASSRAGLVEQVRDLVEIARAEGRQPPGRHTVMAETGASEHHVKLALAQVRAELGTTDPSIDTAVPPATAPAGGAPSHTISSGSTGLDNPDGDPLWDASPRAGAAAAVEPGGGRAVAWIGLVFGALSSLAANWLHTWLPATTQRPGWTPGLAPQIGAMIWPLALLLAVEVVSRVRWPHGWTWWLARFGGAGLVAAGSALISYGHLHDVLVSWHYTPAESAVGPLVLDGLMTVCGVALLADGTHQRHPDHHQRRQVERPARLPRPRPPRPPADPRPPRRRWTPKRGRTRHHPTTSRTG